MNNPTPSQPTDTLDGLREAALGVERAAFLAHLHRHAQSGQYTAEPDSRWRSFHDELVRLRTRVESLVSDLLRWQPPPPPGASPSVVSPAVDRSPRGASA